MRCHRSVVGVIGVILGLATAPAFADKDEKPEATRLEQQLKEAQARIASLLKEVKLLREKAIAAEIKEKSSRNRVADLEKQVQRLTAELARLKGGKGPGGAPPANHPPAEDVEGLVTEVKDGKIRISIGSDAGLVKGHTLEVFRTSPNAKYLGRLRVVKVEAKEATCEAMGKKVEVQKGDRVASRIGGR
jgi:hypothetical protein